jgi:RHS repeat-associated protein
VTYRLVGDQLGSVRMVLNATTGEVVQQIDYDAWGRVLTDTNPGFQPFGFAGGLFDPLTGLVHFGSREYDPESGRWLAKDAIGFAGGSNLYAYVGDDPINRLDPSGNDWEDDLFDDGGQFLTGLADGLSFGIGALVRREFFPDLDAVVDPCSLSYRIGSYTPLVIGGGRMAYAGLAKGVSLLARGAVELGAVEAESAALGAANARTGLKQVFRGGLFPKYRVRPASAMLEKYGDPSSLIDAAGRTNGGINAAGTALATSGEGNEAVRSSRCCR